MSPFILPGTGGSFMSGRSFFVILDDSKKTGKITMGLFGFGFPGLLLHVPIVFRIKYAIFF